MGTWCQRFDRFASLLDTNPSKAEILLAVDQLLDDARSYRSLTMSQHARQMVRRVIAEHLWTGDQAHVEAPSRT